VVPQSISNKLEITQSLVKHLDGVNEAEAMSQWWRNTRPESGLRLSEEGYKVFVTQLFVKKYSISIEYPDEASGVTNTWLKHNPRILLDLDRYLTCPYYFPPRKKAIVLFGEQEANMVSLYNGDIVLYMKNTSAWY
jgi:hypothetical protein